MYEIKSPHFTSVYDYLYSNCDYVGYSRENYEWMNEDEILYKYDFHPINATVELKDHVYNIYAEIGSPVYIGSVTYLSHYGLPYTTYKVLVEGGKGRAAYLNSNCDIRLGREKNYPFVFTLVEYYKIGDK